MPEWDEKQFVKSSYCNCICKTLHSITSGPTPFPFFHMKFFSRWAGVQGSYLCTHRRGCTRGSLYLQLESQSQIPVPPSLQCKNQTLVTFCFCGSENVRLAWRFSSSFTMDSLRVPSKLCVKKVRWNLLDLTELPMSKKVRIYPQPQQDKCL